MSIQQDITNGLLSSPKINGYTSNAISGATPRATQWTKETAIMYETVGVYANNVFDAEIQGLDYNDFYAWKRVKLRASNVVDTSTGNALTAGWQEILILGRHTEFVPLGAFVKFNKATWIVVNSNSATMDSPSAIVVRCNTIYHTYDYYGNIVSIPFCLTDGKVLASSSFYTKYMVEIDGYAHIVMQLNEYTNKIHNTSRLIIGKSAYNIFGVVDSMMEFTDIEGSNHLLKADLRLTDVLPNDDMVNGIANGDSFDIYIKAEGQKEMIVGSTQTLTVKAFKDDAIIQSTVEHPLTYEWSSSNENVATVNNSGVVTGVADGQCNIVCTLKENKNLQSTVSVKVSSATSNDWVQFDVPVPTEARAFDKVIVSASYFEDGVKTAEQVSFAFSGADSNSYTTTPNGNTVTIDIWRADSTPLTITASKGSSSVNAIIKLLGI